MIRDYLISGAQEAGLEVPHNQLSAFELFASELKKWNSKINLTSITDDRGIAVKHIIDALFFARMVKADSKVLDIGSGAGIPALPLKIVKPEIAVVSVDAVSKKILFQRQVARLLGLKKFEAVHARVENLYGLRGGKFDLITSRAFSDLITFVRLAAPLLAENGCMIAMKGPAATRETTMDETVLSQMGFMISAIHDYKLPFNSGERCLVVIETSKPS